MLSSTFPEKDGCITAQILDSRREPVTVRSEDEVYDGLFLMWRGQLLLNGLVMACLSSMVAMPLNRIGKGR
jgi:hypothetical protein